MKNSLSGILVSLVSCFTVQSCCGPGVATLNSGFPQSVTETHTKTTLVAPPSYSTPYLPPAAICQTAPMAAPMPMMAPVCPPTVYQAPAPVYQAAPCVPVQSYQAAPCQPVQSYRVDPCQTQTYQSPQYQADPCAPYGTQMRYNGGGYVGAPNPQYVIVNPHGGYRSQPLPPQATNSDEDR